MNERDGVNFLCKVQILFGAILIVVATIFDLLFAGVLGGCIFGSFFMALGMNKLDMIKYEEPDDRKKCSPRTGSRDPGSNTY